MDQVSQTQEITGDLSFREVADRWTVPLMVLDRELCFVYANRAYLTATNTEWANIRQKYIFDIFPEVEERRDPVEAKFRQVFQGMQTRLEVQPYELKQPDGTVQTRMWQAVQDPYRNDDGVVTHMIQRAEDITAQVELKRQNDVIQNELDHRIRNMFAVIMATSRISGESAESVDTFVDDFNERLASMSRVYSNLTRSDWKGLSLRKIMIEELDAMLGRGSQRYTLRGSDAILTVKGSKDAALIVHELAANARKFGCFSTPAGHLTVEWTLKGDVLRVTWTETGVPGIQPPTRVGFGTRLFDMFPKLVSTRTFTQDGVQIIVEAPLLREDVGAFSV
jgi:two-component sensor histidine kinase